MIFLLKLNVFPCSDCVIVNIYSILPLHHYLAVVFKEIRSYKNHFLEHGSIPLCYIRWKNVWKTATEE